MERFTQVNPATLRDIDLNAEARGVCIESILTLLQKAEKHGGSPFSTSVYVEEGEEGILSMNLRVRFPEVGSLTVPLMKVGPMYWAWSDEEGEN